MARMALALALLLLLAPLASVCGWSGHLGDPKHDKCTYYAQTPGGCPDITQCQETCRPCYRGVGNIHAECNAPGVGIPFWECRCYFEAGAPCPPPPGGPACPKPPARLSVASSQGHPQSAGLRGL